MSHALTQPAPLDSKLGARTTAGFQPLRWLRTRLFKRRQLTDAARSTFAGFPAPISRGYALRRAHRALCSLFLEQEGLRQVLPHLSLLERALARQGSKALRRVPTAVLHNALEQLEDLQSSENHPDLGVLRTRIVESLALRSVITQHDSGPGAALSIFGVEVKEASQSDFDDAARQIAGRAQRPPRQ